MLNVASYFADDRTSAIHRKGDINMMTLKITGMNEVQGKEDEILQ